MISFNSILHFLDYYTQLRKYGLGSDSNFFPISLFRTRGMDLVVWLIGLIEILWFIYLSISRENESSSESHLSLYYYL